MAIDNKENKAKEITKEDKDQIVDVSEIQRIVKLYTGRAPFEQEIQRFNGMKESELKIMTDYLNEERTKMQNEGKNMIDSQKIKGDLANKEMKLRGNVTLDAMKNNAMPAQMPPQMAPPMREMQGMAPGMAPGSSPMPGEATPQNKKFIKDGKNFLIQFKN